MYSWYLLYLTPFLLVRTTLPLIAWSCSVLLTYVVWEIARDGGRWIVPVPVLGVEYGIVVAVAIVWWLRRAGNDAQPVGVNELTPGVDGRAG